MIRVTLTSIGFSSSRWMAGPLILAGLLVFAPTTWADDGSEHKQHAAQMRDEATLLEQITELRANVARLEAGLEQNHLAVKKPPTMAMPGKRGGMQGMGGMPSMDQASSDQGMTGGMRSMKTMKSMGDASPMKPMEPAIGSMGETRSPGMMGMDRMKMMGMRRSMGASPAAMSRSAIPGFPGASHLYHVGAAGFFLNHSQHITLTEAQQKTLNQIQERVMLNKATADRQIEEVEQALWMLTGADEPNAGKIEAKVRQIEKLKGDQRMAFIRAVGEAATVLTDEQRKILVGQMPRAATMPTMTAPKKPNSPSLHQGMP